MTEQTNWWTDSTVSFCFTLFVFGGLRQLSSYKQCSGEFILLWEQLVYSVMEKKKTTEFVFILQNFVVPLLR